jgi:hypothetical protein
MSIEKELMEYKALTPEKCFGSLLQLRDLAHLNHLYPSNPGSTGSGWQHSALGGFYGDLLDLVDGLVESYQGKYGLKDIEIPASKRQDTYSLIASKAKELEANKDKIFKDSWVLNQVDEILALMYSTLYKLKNLK